MTSYLPIIYVRGYAGSASAVESAVECPYYGFNEGSTKVRTGPGGDPELYIFESPLIRLMKDHDYTDFFVRVENDEVVLLKSKVERTYPAASLWVFRYYDDTSADIGTKTRHRIEELGKQLVKVIDFVRAKTRSPQVHLVAHSMGGLVCRSAIQKTMKKTESEKKISRLFTYGTPHGGIHFRSGLGGAARVRDFLGMNHSDNFGPKEMRLYLGFPKNHPEGRLHELGGQFDPLRCFSFIGTNHDDYTVGIAKLSVGPGSDGLVMIRHASIKGSNRAFAHRSHSGPYGIVNSEEGYQNLQRFLFGDTAVKVSLRKVVPKSSVRQRSDGSELQTVVLETEFALRAESVLLSEQLQRDGSAHALPIQELEDGEETLFRAFLMREKRANPQTKYSQFQLQVRIVPVYVRNGLLGRSSAYGGQAIFSGSLFVEVGDPDDEDRRKVKLGWGTMEDVLKNASPVVVGGTTKELEIDLPTSQQWIDSGKIAFEIEPWKIAG